MRYLRYIGILIFTLFRKVFGLVWYFIAVPFRKYARNTVHNYSIQKNLYFPRRQEKDIKLVNSKYIIAPSHGTNGGYINYRYVSKIEYTLVYWFIWGWLDDDSFGDTTGETFVKEYRDGKRTPNFYSTEKYNKILSKCNGNYFDVGDAQESNWAGWMSVMWNVRNCAYNFKYTQWECNNPKHLFYKKIGNWHFGYLPKGNEREGRLVFGSF